MRFFCGLPYGAMGLIRCYSEYLKTVALAFWNPTNADASLVDTRSYGSQKITSKELSSQKTRREQDLCTAGGSSDYSL